MFQPVRAHWQLNSCLLASCSKAHKPCVLSHTAMSIVEDIGKLICEVERRPPLYNKIERIQRQKSEGRIVVRSVQVSRHELK